MILCAGNKKDNTECISSTNNRISIKILTIKTLIRVTTDTDKADITAKILITADTVLTARAILRTILFPNSATETTKLTAATHLKVKYKIFKGAV